MRLRFGQILFTPVALVILLCSTSAQDNQPTIEQCHADVATWARTMGVQGYSNMPYTDIVAREGEVLKCRSIDTDEKFKSLYEMHMHATELEIRWRLAAFVKRHNLMQQFVLEDSQGER